MKKILLLTLLIIGIKAQAKDTLVLNNQLTYTVNITKLTATEVEFKANAKHYVIPATQVTMVKFQNPNNPIYVNYVKSINDGGNNCAKGFEDARQFHGKKGGHVILGALFGPFAIIGTALSNPTPEKGVRTYMLSKNNDLFNNYEYISCYRRQAKSSLITMELLGWLTWVLLLKK